jgi:nuclear pore complex protein Nup62
MDEILTRWATDLTKYTKEFKTHAETLALWDQKIVENSSKIDKLYVKTRTCEKQTMSVEMQLTAVENQQAELESWLAKYEAEVDGMLEKESGNPVDVGGPDQEREKTYKLAEKLSERLDEMGTNLESMVEEVNAVNAGLSKNGKADEPVRPSPSVSVLSILTDFQITQIVKILNQHLNQLQAIDNGASVLQSKVAEAQKAARGVGYLNGHHGNGSTASDDFYRSYMGRR